MRSPLVNSPLNAPPTRAVNISQSCATPSSNLHNTNEVNHLYLQPYLTNHYTQQFTAAHIKSKPYRTRQTLDIRTYNRIQTATNPSTRQPTEHIAPTTVDVNRQPTNTCPFKPIYKYETSRPPYTQHHNAVDLTHPRTAHLPAMSTPPDDQRPSTSR